MITTDFSHRAFKPQSTQRPQRKEEKNSVNLCKSVSKNYRVNLCLIFGMVLLLGDFGDYAYGCCDLICPPCSGPDMSCSYCVPSGCPYCGHWCCCSPWACDNGTCCPPLLPKGNGWIWTINGWAPICCPSDKPKWCEGATACYNPDTEECCGAAICDKATQKCCGGSCCNKVWTKETHPAIKESCPSLADCPQPGGGCDGTIVTQQQSYDSCLIVGVGQGGEHCVCHQSLQVVGHKYTCEEDWDWSMMLSCAAEAGLCALQCLGANADPASCAECLASFQTDCCGGDTCHICDFLESCDPLYPEEIKDNVFTGFDDCP